VSNVHVEPEWLEALRRNSGLALDEEGRWRFGAGFVENERVSELFSAGLAVREDGEVTVTVGAMWAYVRCAGPAFLVRTMRRDASGAVVFGLAGGRELGVDAIAGVGWGPDERLYLWLDGAALGAPGTGARPALVSRVVHQALIAGLDDVDGRLTLAIAGRRFEVRRLSERPGPASALPGVGAA
jgi:hypothetical protein